MASNYINNLSNTYQQSPSLQNQFATEQDYLDLFDNNQVTPAMAQAYVPVDDTTGIKSITNTAKPIINETGGDGPTDPTGPGYGYTGPGSTVSETGFNIDDIGEGTVDSVDNIGTGITGKGLMAAIGFAMNPIGFFVGRYAKQQYKEYKERKEKQDAIDKAKKEAEEAVAQGRAYDYAGRDNQYGTHTSTISKEQAASNRESGRSKGTSSSGMSSSARGAAMHGARGGFVPTGLSRGSYFKGGIVSLRRR
jgi:hypothetical protein